MKRVKAACICQTLHFMLKEDAAHDYAVKMANEEVEHYKKNLERTVNQRVAIGVNPAAMATRYFYERMEQNGNKSVFGNRTY